MLTFGEGNAKLGRNVYTFSLPAGHTCPGALTCLAYVDRVSNKLVDGPEATLRCFAASAEAMYTNVRDSRAANHEALEAARLADGWQGMTRLLHASLPAKAKLVRVHVSGDFYRPEYLRAWLAVACLRPGVRFYAYTKSVSLVLAQRKDIPSNFVFTFSYGGRQDHLIASSGIQSARVFMTEDEAKAAGLPVDHDDSHAYSPAGDFGLMIHGTQPKGSEAARALTANRRAGLKHGYSRKGAKHARHR